MRRLVCIRKFTVVTSYECHLNCSVIFYFKFKNCVCLQPRSEEDRQQFKEDLKRYKANKEKLKRQKEFILQQTRKQLREVDSKKARDKRARAMLKSRIKEMPDFNSEHAKKIKESFRANMASTVVGSLNAYRKPDCKEGRITNTEDFKHLARKVSNEKIVERK